MVFKFKIIINVLVTPFRFVLIPMSWVYCHNKSINSYSPWIAFRRRNLTHIVGHRTERVNAGPALVQCLILLGTALNLTYTAPKDSDCLLFK